MPADRELIDELRRSLEEVADASLAAAMQRYMKSALPFHGVRAPVAAKAFRRVIAGHPLPDEASWVATVRALWHEASHREEWYGALALAGHRLYRAYQLPRTLDLYRELVVTGAWWDVVDDIASHLVGPILRSHHDDVRPVIVGWARDDDRWLRRTAVICQLGAKANTDLELLATCIEANVEDEDFFIRKAIGWALRQYAWTDPVWVGDFVAAHDGELSPLSRREATKHLGAAAT